jgi:hypothetical protein
MGLLRHPVFVAGACVALLGGGLARAEFHTIRFLNDPPVPTGHLPDSGGILISTSHNFQEEGIHVEGIWAPSTHVGLTQGHFHHLENGFETSHGFGNADAFGWHDLLGFYIVTLDGRPLSLRSIDYRLRVNLLNTDILVSTQLDATQPFGGQFLHFPVGRFSTFQTQSFTQFENVNQVFISSILADPNGDQIQWDNIVIWTDPWPEGACCTSTGISCTQETAADCATLGGTYLGDDVPCSAGSYCPTLAGACCTPDATSCDMKAPSSCTLPAGVFAGLGTECDAQGACPVESGRCCMDNGASCQQVLEELCTGADTYFHGAGTNCSDPGDCWVPCDTDADCDDGDVCSGGETCELATGDCLPGASLDCDDDNGCTSDTCDPVNGCANAVLSCDDSDACTVDSCDIAVGCLNVPIVCTDGDACNGLEICNPATGSCQNGTVPDCDDNNVCTTDTCNPTTGCEHESPDCDDLIACTVDDCDPIGGFCTHEPSDALCANGLFCDGVETCDALLGCQAGPATDCDDVVDCTDDACNEATDQCDHTPDDLFCDNGVLCDGAEVCDLVLDCQPGPAETCDDGVGCTVDVCNVTTDACENGPDNAACDNGLYCDGEETCDALLDCQTGVAVDCDDNIACTVDACNEALDACDYVPDNAACDDGVFCNGVETCSDLDGCLAGNNPCLAGELCDENLDLCSVAVVSGVWMTFTDSASIPGVGTVENEDVVAYNEGTGTWSLIFDGSDVGLSAFTIDGLARLDDGSLLLSFAEPGSLPGMTGGPSGTTIDDSDIVQFIPANLGSTTFGSFGFYFDGSDVGLTGDGEDVDALIVTASGQLILSTNGGVSVSGVSGVHADLLIFTPSGLGSVTAGTWAMYFDGSDVGFGSSGTEDLDAAAFSFTGAPVVSTVGDFNVPGLLGPNEDAIQFNATALGDVTSGTFAPLLDLTALAIDPSENLGGIEIVP